MGLAFPMSRMNSSTIWPVAGRRGWDAKLISREEWDNGTHLFDGLFSNDLGSFARFFGTDDMVNFYYHIGLRP